MKKRILLLLALLISINISAQIMGNKPHAIEDLSTIKRIENVVNENNGYSEEIYEEIFKYTLSFINDRWLYVLSYEPLDEKDYDTKTRLRYLDKKTNTVKNETKIEIKNDICRAIQLYATKIDQLPPIKWKKSNFERITKHPYLIDDREVSINEVNKNIKLSKGEPKGKPKGEPKGLSIVEKIKFDDVELIVILIGVRRELDGSTVDYSTTLIILEPIRKLENGFIYYNHLTKQELNKDEGFKISRREGNVFYENNGNKLEITYDKKRMGYKYYDSNNKLLKYRK